MERQYYCNSQRRIAQIRRHKSENGMPLFNAIDYLEVSPDQKILEVHFINNLPGEENGVPVGPALKRENLLIEGGARIKEVSVADVSSCGDVLTVRVSVPGDFSNYRLRLIKSSRDQRCPDGFDSQLSEVKFSFKVDCPTELDCQRKLSCYPDRRPDPQIDYMSRDYASFRRQILDRLSVIMPDWKERNPADLGIVLIELMAYIGDYLSYYQDAVATEAYLETARKRISVRRHARLLDYAVHEGCNSRTWACFIVDGKGPVRLRKRDELNGQITKLLTRCLKDTAVDCDRADEVISTYRPEVFELMHDATFYSAHNMITFYTWSQEFCCIPRGTTSATFKDDPMDPLHLQPGDVLILEELRGLSSGDLSTADPTHRQAVRLVSVRPKKGNVLKDSLTGQQIVEVEWHPEDALPFSLCISARIRGRTMRDMSCARGNVALVDNGDSREENDSLPAVPLWGEYQPRMKRHRLAFCADYDHQSAQRDSASSVVRQDPSEALPALSLRDSERGIWLARRDLLGCDRFAAEFVVEVEDGGNTSLRFGDDVMGKRPSPGTMFKVRYRVGGGARGNVGAESIAHISSSEAGRILKVWNPLPARGGTDPEATAQVRLYAPYAFSQRECAVTESDYAEIAQRHPEVARAVATKRLFGCQCVVRLIVERKDHVQVLDAGLRKRLRSFLEDYRLMGHEIEIEAPHYVPLQIAFTVRVSPEYRRSNVKRALLEAFGSTEIPGGERGFFHPGNFSFGEPVYLSKIVARAVNVPGVDGVEFKEDGRHKFTRLWNPSKRDLERGIITIGPLEIARLDNDPNSPENGRIDFFTEGGI
jgi:hypothetical protein